MSRPAPSNPALARPAVPAVPLTGVLPWLALAVLLAVVGTYFVSVEEGAFALLGTAGVHEWVHDGRHLLGFPCH